MEELLTIHNYTEIYVNRKRKKTEDNNYVGTEVSGLTLVSLASSESPTDTTGDQSSSPEKAKSYAEVLKKTCGGSVQNDPPTMVTILQKLLDQ